jgi:hypothetical protein
MPTNLTAVVKQKAFVRVMGSVEEYPCPIGCGRTINAWSFEGGHIVPKSRGGPNEPDNIVPICSHCNKSMGNTHMVAYMKDNGLESPWLTKYINQSRKKTLDEGYYFFISPKDELEGYDHKIELLGDVGYVTYVNKERIDSLDWWCGKDIPFKKSVPLNALVTYIKDGVICTSIADNMNMSLICNGTESEHINELVDTLLRNGEDYFHKIIQHQLDMKWSNSPYQELIETMTNERFNAVVLNNWNFDQYGIKNLPDSVLSYFKQHGLVNKV